MTNHHNVLLVNSEDWSGLVWFGLIKGLKPTCSVRFSTNEGETWTSFQFSPREVFVYQLLTEPGEKSTIFTIFGSYADQRHSWLILQVDAAAALGRSEVRVLQPPANHRLRHGSCFYPITPLIRKTCSRVPLKGRNCCLYIYLHSQLTMFYIYETCLEINQSKPLISQRG